MVPFFNQIKFVKFTYRVTYFTQLNKDSKIFLLIIFLFIQILGDTKRHAETYDLGCVYYDKSSCLEGGYKLNQDKWWSVHVSYVKKMLKDPVEEKVSGHRKLYYFDF